VVDAGLRLSDNTGSLLQDLVVHGAGASIDGSAALDDVAVAPGSSSTMGPGVSGLYLPGSPALCPTHRLQAGGG
jgi:hypothetical protein